MVRLTAELILSSPAFTNPLKQRELDLRGNKIAIIENLGATEDQYDVLDFSDNDIIKLDGFPLLPRLNTILLNNNKLAVISSGLGSKIANIETLVLTNNKIANLGDLDPISEFKKLANLSLLKNPVIRHPQYRLYLIYKIPTLKWLDFQKVKKQERIEAKALFGGEEGQKLKQSIEKTRTFEPGRTMEGLTAEQKEKIRAALDKAETLADIQSLERILQSQKFPKDFDYKFGDKKGQQPEGSAAEGMETENAS
eukprot:TRINITY_DN11572_c0_g1_i1.p1 TRINITY_DN11572_c0_g1~~TRINITY_DN11572_c0_g1_i1.p1  ORF type:complete len:253 (+),score=63.93 TRINITY_DN11572_c0_g1_i1:79-837(+)